MATLETKYTVNPAYQAAFDALQQKTIDFVRTNDSINISIIQTIQRLQHLMLIVKLRSKTEPKAEWPDTSSNYNGDALIAITAKSSIVQDIERMIEIYNQYFCNLETVNSTITKNLVKLAMQDISDNKDIEWYREFLRFKKIEAVDFSEKIRALQSLADNAIAQGASPQVVAPKDFTTEDAISENDKVGSIFMICATIFVYVLYIAIDSCESTN